MSTLYTAPVGPAQPVAPVEPPQRNTVGIIALVCAIAGFIFGCIPGAFILGWILLPIGFILGIIGLFMKAKKGTAVAAVIVSIVGTIVSVIVFLFAVGRAFDESFNQDVFVAGPESAVAPVAEGSAAQGGSAAGSTRDNPLPIGATVENEEWSVTLNSVDLDATDAVTAENPVNDQPGPDQAYALANVTITYKGDNPQGSMPMPLIEYVTPDGRSVTSFDTLVVAPDALDTLTSLYSGASVSGNEAFLIPAGTAGEGVLAIQPDLLSKKAFFAVR
ncbi:MULTISPECIES: DUF4190 domain-containing protein [Corynebacterium]|uniref:DUF4190 domain-containing protein n=1 Tax=Corynebacterium TaxID=1716 RepID=UPI0011A75D0A|nr:MULTISPECIES: DUF4190 domain-containing protein [Corynebacterium]MCT1462812.1 DUF4352 domain-containing protein [Corynebacterium sanguinis]MCT1627954.1 DUF4352 domain-containing protein [Corynebacterium sanguinis]MCT1804424.1 DUF4352 domain-containing protein [Corynebacterium sanguinis]MCT2157755.1 DUF4352 domain-containing protein [Corynebacterium sanguinis]MCT2329062.1 DUF4352 domain-containing protein [Corynebacterium sanguinis]